MKPLITTILLSIASVSFSQEQGLEPTEISADHWSYLRQFDLTEIDNEQVMSDARAKNYQYGRLFLITDIDQDQFQFQVLTCKKYGSLKKRIYLGVFEEQGDDLRLIYSRGEKLVKPKGGSTCKTYLQAISLDRDGTYYILVAGEKKGKSFTVRTSQKFRTNQARAANALGSSGDKSKLLIGRLRGPSGTNYATKTITLTTIDGEVIKMVVPDDRGEFQFANLPHDESYIVHLDEEDSHLDASIHLFDAEGNLEKTSVKEPGGSFTFSKSTNGFNQVRLLSRPDYAIYPKKGTEGIAGKVVDQYSLLYGQEGVKIELLDKHGHVIGETQTNEEGNFNFNNLPLDSYTARVVGPMDEIYVEMVQVTDMNIPVEFSNSKITGGRGEFDFENLPKEEIELQKMKEAEFQNDNTDFSRLNSGEPIILKNITFNTNQATMTVASYSELGHLLDFVQQYPNLKIEISGHTDDQGSPRYNRTLSQDRADAVAAYLIGQGIPQTQIVTIGRGESMPITSNVTEEGRNKNRRVEVRAIK
ncbi:MAG: hypothetical protein Salg2KO_20650 [Salibacteraceae bacterium]